MVTVISQILLYVMYTTAYAGAPDRPRNVSAFAADQNTINVYWNQSRSLSEPVLVYTVCFNDQKLQSCFAVKSKTSAKMKNLKAYTNYSIYIRGYSNRGVSPRSQVITVMTHPDTGAPDRPRNVSAFAADQNTINVYWNQSLSLLEPVLTYTVEIESNDPRTAARTIILMNNKTSTKIKNLKAYTNYSIYIRGYSNRGASPRSQVITVMTHPDTGAPDCPKNVSAFAADQSTINVYWNQSLSRLEPVLAYTVHIEESNDPRTAAGAIIVVNNKTSTKIKNLKAYTNYSIYIRGYSNRGASPRSQVITVMTHPDKCRPGFHGQNCGQRCSVNCKVTNRCNRLTGECDGGCKPGWKTPTCQQECRPGFHGQNCGQTCSKNCKVTNRCNRLTGECDGGCKPGWKAPTCQQECDGGVYGAGCTQICGFCLHNKQCHHVNGTCLNGCSPGYQGGPCEESCNIGYFGISCLHSCTVYCGGNGTCDKITGICEEGCREGWSGPLCGTEALSSCSTCFTDDNTAIIISIVAFLLIVLVGCVVIFLIWKRNQPENVKRRVGSQYTDLGILDKPNTYEEIHYYVEVVGKSNTEI